MGNAAVNAVRTQDPRYGRYKQVMALRARRRQTTSAGQMPRCARPWPVPVHLHGILCPGVLAFDIRHARAVLERARCKLERIWYDICHITRRLPQGAYIGRGSDRRWVGSGSGQNKDKTQQPHCCPCCLRWDRAMRPRYLSSVFEGSVCYTCSLHTRRSNACGDRWFIKQRHLQGRHCQCVRLMTGTEKATALAVARVAPT